MISQHAYLLFFSDANLESESSLGSVRDWKVFFGGRRNCGNPIAPVPTWQRPLRIQLRSAETFCGDIAEQFVHFLQTQVAAGHARCAHWVN